MLYFVFLFALSVLRIQLDKNRTENKYRRIQSDWNQDITTSSFFRTLVHPFEGTRSTKITIQWKVNINFLHKEHSRRI